MEGVLLDVRRLTKRFGGLVAVNEVDFTVRPERIVSLIGPNGAGKNDPLQHGGRLLPHLGEIVFAGAPIHRLQPAPDHRPGSRAPSRTSASSAT